MPAEYAEYGDTGLVVRHGEGLLDLAGNPLHGQGHGPHVVFDDGRHEWVRAWPVAEDDYEGLVEQDADPQYGYIAVDGTAIQDVAVAFYGTGTPEESKAEYFTEKAVAEGWTREDWESISGNWPTWELDTGLGS